MTTLKLVTCDQHLVLQKQPVVASGDKNSVLVQIELCSMWDGFDVKVAFYKDGNRDFVLDIPLEDGACMVPPEMLDTPCVLNIGIWGKDARGRYKTSTMVKYRVLEGTPIEEGVRLVAVNDGTATEDQVLDGATFYAGDTAKKTGNIATFEEGEPEYVLKGDPGESAYEIAVKRGFEGTEEEWIASLKKPAEDAAKNVVDIANDAAENALEQAKESGEFDGKSAYDYAKDGGYTGTEEEFAEDINPDNIKADIAEAITDEVADILKEEIPLVKAAEQPTFVNSVDEMTDKSKVYVMPDGYFYGYVERKNYNLLKLSEVFYSSRLQNDVEGIVSSTAANCVTGIIPVKYGKYYALSKLYGGEVAEWVGKRTISNYPTTAPDDTFIQRINAIKSDGTVIVYGNTWKNMVNGIIVMVTNGLVITMPDPDIVAVQLHIASYNPGVAIDTSTREKLSAVQYMFVEGDTAQEAYDNSVNNAYIDGDLEVISEWYNTGLAYNQPANYEDRVVDLESEMSDVKEDLSRFKDNMSNPELISPFYREVNWGCVPTEYFRGRGDSYSVEGFTNNTQYADYIAKFKSLIVGHEAYVTETHLGNSSDGQPLYAYDFKPVRWDNEMTNIPKIIIVAGHHGTEKCNIFGIYYFVKDLLNNWFGSSALEYLRNNVELMIVPVVNTYGFDNFEYKNANGVNINRNYSSDWKLLDDTESPQYGGAEPFDQPESQIIRDLVLSNSDAVLVIDSHTNSATNTASWGELGYYGINNIDDAYFNRIRNALPELVAKISPNFNVDYHLNAPNTMFGFLSVGGGNGIFRTWTCDNDILGVLIEGFAGFLEGEPVSADVFKANEEQMVNWLITAMYYLAK